MKHPAPAAASRLDRILLSVAPQWALNRIRSRVVAQTIMRYYEAAASGRRTENWRKPGTDANAAAGASLGRLRNIARDLVRNNGWAVSALRAITEHTVGWGIVPTPSEEFIRNDRFMRAWKRWSRTTQCDPDGRCTFAGLQRLAMREIAESGEVLIRRRLRRANDGLDIPLQFQILEADFLDTSRESETSASGGPIVQGVEYDAIGRRSAYWLFDVHPGSTRLGSYQSRRIPATEIIHAFEVYRAGQVRGVSWFAPVIVKLKDFDEYDDATLMRQKIASCFVAFVTNVNGDAGTLGEPSATDDLVETLEPGMVSRRAPGEEVTFGTPPTVSDYAPYARSTLQAVAAGIGVTYEDMTGDYSGVNFSSARMARISHWSHVYDWQWNMLIPVLCGGLWDWVVDAAAMAGLSSAVDQPLPPEWTTPPIPMLEPDKEGLASQRLVRGGAKTFSDVVREQGRDPEEFFEEYARDQERLDKLGIKLDSDVRAVSQAGQVQQLPAAKAATPVKTVAKPSGI